MSTLGSSSLGAKVLIAALLVAACKANEQSLGTGADGGEGGSEVSAADLPTDTATCEGISQCSFPCPDGTVNPKDQNGCEHTCTCVLAEVAAAGPVPLQMYSSCGDPVCGGAPRPMPGVPACATSDVEGVRCAIEGIRCNLQNECNQVLICARRDPKTALVGGCPISRRSYKRDIHYLGAKELAPYERELLDLKLATWRYKHDPARLRLGFIIDDKGSSVAVEGTGDRVDLYGYASLAVATLQRQARQIAALEREVARLRRQLPVKRKR
jgi:hypothetical protein